MYIENAVLAGWWTSAVEITVADLHTLRQALDHAWTHFQGAECQFARVKVALESGTWIHATV